MQNLQELVKELDKPEAVLFSSYHYNISQMGLAHRTKEKGEELLKRFAQDLAGKFIYSFRWSGKMIMGVTARMVDPIDQGIVDSYNLALKIIYDTNRNKSRQSPQLP